MKCFHCSAPLNGDFIQIGFGGLLKSDNCSTMSDDVDHFLDVSCHSDTLENYDSVFLVDKFQINMHGQSESYFCTKKCLLDWFAKQIECLPEPRP